MSALCADCATLTTALEAAASALEQAADDLTIDETNRVDTVEGTHGPLDVALLAVVGLEESANEAAEAARAARSALAQVGGAKVGQFTPAKGTEEGSVG